jgi:aryl-alcohol dehydrogenase-like predicted oxidoreductase
LKGLIRYAYEKDIRTFMTADVYGEGEADQLLGEVLAGFDRNSYCLIGAVGHDFYKGKRQGEKGFPRFTDPALRKPSEYAGYLQMAAEKSLERLKTNYFDLLFLHNPDSTGYTHEAVWQGLEALKKQGLTHLLGIAPGPANGFTLDMIGGFEKFGASIDWAMIILNPLEPWPASFVLPAAEKYNVKILTRVVEHGGLFHDGLRTSAHIARDDHRAFRPAGWVEAAQGKLDRCREIAKEQGLTLLQLAAHWGLAQPAVESVAPTFIQEADPEAKPIEKQVEELAMLPAGKILPAPVVQEITLLGDNKNSMSLKGASAQYLGEPQADQWPITPKLEEIARRWNIVPDRDLYYARDPRDLRETGLAKKGVPQTSTRRLYLQLQAFGNAKNPQALAGALQTSGLESVLYLDMNDPAGVAVLFMAENPDLFVKDIRLLLRSEPFSSLTLKPELTMTGRTYSAGREENLEDWLLVKPRRNALNPAWPWAVWYPLRRKSEFELLSKQEQGKILFEHAMIGRNYGQAGYAADIRLASYGLDQNDNEFVLGLVGPELYFLSRLVQDMRKTQQTAKYIQSLGPFFIGKVFWQSPSKI